MKNILNLPVLIGSIVGGVVGAAASVFLLGQLQWDMADWLLVAICFAVFGGCVAIGYLLGTIMLGQPNQPTYWVLPLIPVALFAAGAIFQLIYGLQFPSEIPKPIDDYIIVLDNSGSMSVTDPNNERLPALQATFEAMPEQKRISFHLFSGECEEIVPLDYVIDAQKNKLVASLQNIHPDGGTDIEAALNMALTACDNTQITPPRTQAIILLSDGESSVNVDAVAARCKVQNVRIFTVGMNSLFGSRLLQKIAGKTGGKFYTTQSMSSLSGILRDVNSSTEQRNLLDIRGITRNSVWAGALRVLFIVLTSLLLQAAFWLFTNENSLRKLSLIKGAAGGLLSGAILELGFLAFMPRWLLLLLVWTIIAASFHLYDENYSSSRFKPRRVPASPPPLPVKPERNLKAAVTKEPQDDKTHRLG